MILFQNINFLLSPEKITATLSLIKRNLTTFSEDDHHQRPLKNLLQYPGTRSFDSNYLSIWGCLSLFISWISLSMLFRLLLCLFIFSTMTLPVVLWVTYTEHKFASNRITKLPVHIGTSTCNVPYYMVPVPVCNHLIKKFYVKS
jgi:hypothetical protein